MSSEPIEGNSGSDREYEQRVQSEIDSCDKLLRRLTEKEPLPYDAIEAMLFAKGVAERRLPRERDSDRNPHSDELWRRSNHDDAG